VLPEAVSAPVISTVLDAVTEPARVAAAFTVTVWLPPAVPRTVFPVTVNDPAVLQHTSYITTILLSSKHLAGLREEQ